MTEELAAPAEQQVGVYVVAPGNYRHRSARLEIEPLGIARVAPPDNLVDEAAIGIERVEIARPAQQEPILDCLLEMAVRALDRPVLVRHAPVVAGRFHTIMRAQRFVATREVLLCIAIEVAEGC